MFVHFRTSDCNACVWPNRRGGLFSATLSHFGDFFWHADIAKGDSLKRGYTSSRKEVSLSKETESLLLL